MYVWSNTSTNTAVHNAIYNFNLPASIRGVIIGDTNVTFTDANIVAGSFSITNQCSSDTELSIGQVYVGELNITLTGLTINRYALYGKPITVDYYLNLGSGVLQSVALPLGTYIISEVEQTAVGFVIRAYDNMSLFDVPFAETSLSGTPYNLASAACTACGLTLATTSTQFNAFPNGTRTITATRVKDTDGNYSIPEFSTYRDVLSAIAQVCCCNVLIDRSGQVVFSTYPSTAVDTIDTSHRKMGGMTADYETYYDGIIVTDPTTKKQTKYTRSNPSGLTMDLGDNPFINTTAVRNAILNGLTFRFHPFRMDILNVPLYDLMDCIYLPDGVGDDTKLYCITKYTWTYHGSYQLVGAGQDPKLVAVASSAQRSASQASFLAAQKVTSDEMDAAIDSATAQITGNSGGYIVLHDSDNDGEPDELLIMNTPDISTATKVWRWNASGLGYSSTGYSGTYGLAMTQDGAIVANKITTGELGDLAGKNSWNMVTGDISISASGNIDSITTYYAETEDNVAPPWDAPKAYLFASNGDPLYDADGKRLIAKSAWKTSLDVTTVSSMYRWQRQHIVYTNGEEVLTDAVPMQDYYGRANLVMEASEDADGNPIGVISGLADYIKFTAGQLEIDSPQFTLDTEGNATFAGDVVAKSLTLGSNSTAGAFRLLSPDGYTDVNLSGDSNGSYISVTDTTSYARSTLRGQAGSLILSLSSDNGSTYTEIGSLWVNAGTGRSVANIDTIQVGRYHAVTTGNLGDNQQIARWDYTANEAYVYSNEFRLRQSDGSASYVLADWDNTNSRVDVYGGLFAVRNSSNSLLTFAVWDSSNSRAELRSDIFRLRNNSTLYTMLSWDSTQTTPGTKVTASYGSITNVDATKLTAGSYWGSNGEVIHYTSSNSNNLLRAYQYQIGNEADHATFATYSSGVISLNAGIVYGNSYVYSPALKIYDSANSAIKNFAQWNTSDGIVVNADKLYLNDTTAVGTVKEGTGSTTTLANSTATNVASVSLTKGKWLVNAQFNMPVASGDSGRVYVSISTSSATLAYPAYTNVAVNGAAQAAYATNLSRIVEVTGSSSTVYMVANQNTGASKTLTTSRVVLRAICIA